MDKNSGFIQIKDLFNGVYLKKFLNAIPMRNQRLSKQFWKDLLVHFMFFWEKYYLTYYHFLIKYLNEFLRKNVKRHPDRKSLITKKCKWHADQKSQTFREIFLFPINRFILNNNFRAKKNGFLRKIILSVSLKKINK